MISTVDETGVTVTELGLFKITFAKLTISAGMVAEKKRDCLFFGKTANSFLISCTNPMSSIRSASSNTKNSTSLKLK